MSTASVPDIPPRGRGRRPAGATSRLTLDEGGTGTGRETSMHRRLFAESGPCVMPGARRPATALAQVMSVTHPDSTSRRTRVDVAPRRAVVSAVDSRVARGSGEAARSRRASRSTVTTRVSDRSPGSATGVEESPEARQSSKFTLAVYQFELLSPRPDPKSAALSLAHVSRVPITPQLVDRLNWRLCIAPKQGDSTAALTNLVKMAQSSIRTAKK